MKKKYCGKTWWIIALALILTIALAACSQEAAQETEQEEEEEEVLNELSPATFQTFSTGDGYAVVYNGLPLLKSEAPIEVMGNEDGCAAACLTQEGLYLANAVGAVRVTEEQANYGDIHIACDGAAMTYMLDGVLYCYSMEADETVLISEQAQWHDVSADGSCVAYLTEDGPYRWVGESTLLNETEVCDESKICLTDNGGVLYVDAEETLWFVPVDAEADRVDKNVKALWQDGSFFYYTCGENGELQDVYVSRDGADFSAIEGIYYEPVSEET